MRTRTLTWLTVVLAAVLGLAAAATFFRMRGLSTRADPSVAERAVALAARHWAIPSEARQAPNPVSFTPDVWAESRAHFADHCASCHANDGSGQTEIGRNLYPKAPDMRLPATQRLSDGEIYWIIENGVRLTGMPAWGDGSATDEDSWKLVHFIRHLSELTAEQIKEMEALNPRSPAEIKEELDDQRFLRGEDVGQPTSATPPHQH